MNETAKQILIVSTFMFYCFKSTIIHQYVSPEFTEQAAILSFLGALLIITGFSAKKSLEQPSTYRLPQKPPARLIELFDLAPGVYTIVGQGDYLLSKGRRFYVLYTPHCDDLIPVFYSDHLPREFRLYSDYRGLIAVEALTRDCQSRGRVSSCQRIKRPRCVS